MPSTSKAQARLMAAAAHTKGGFGGVPQSVGKEFNEADKAKGYEQGGAMKKYNRGGKVEPSGVDAFAQNLVETAANPTGPKALAKGGPVEHRKHPHEPSKGGTPPSSRSGWKRWGKR